MTPLVKIKRLPSGADLPLPRYESTLAAGMDLRAADDIWLYPGERRNIPTGFAIALPPGFEGQVRPRSGLAMKAGLSVINSPGTVDADYRGEIGVLLINHSDTKFRIERGDRIAQLVIAPVANAVLELVEDLDATERGDGAFGSTGTS